VPASEIEQQVPDSAQSPGLSLHHVQLAMPGGGEEEARRFYHGLLGLKEVEKPTALRGRGGAWFRGPALEVHLGVEQEFRAARKAHPGILTDALERLAAQLTEAGVQVSWDADFPGFRRFYAHDPFGNRLEFLERVAPQRLPQPD
jgi:catechol 2,3-dioxygenase-like lactoylglutathione lyase family enzyme